MRERPILYTGPMVSAILADRKTQTRRLVKIKGHGFGKDPMTGGPTHFIRESDCCTRYLSSDILCHEFCPYGVPGDRLWCKHTHWHKPASDLTPEIVWSEHFPNAIHRDHSGTWVSDLASSMSDIDQHGGFRKRPSIHMPRWASRITLEVVSVRVERVQDISPADAEAEGVFQHVAPYSLDKVFRDERGATAIKYYAELWDSINGKGSWDANPWVWCISFRRVMP